jgi:hypothetical protein
MTTISKIKFSADVQGTGFPISDNATPVTIHSTLTSSAVLDEVWLYVSNSSPTNSHLLQVYFTNAVYTTFIVEVPALSGMVLLVPGLIVSGNGTVASNVAVLDDSGTGVNTLCVYGFVNRITP